MTTLNACSSKNLKKKPPFWSAEFIHHAVTAWRVCQAVSGLNITALFDGVITAVCDLMWLFTALMTNEMLFLARVQTVPSIPAGQIIDPHLLSMTELISLRFWKRLQAFRAASLPSTYPKFLAQMSVISDGQAVDALSDVLLWASLLSLPTACWFYWDKKNTLIFCCCMVSAKMLFHCG